MTRQHWIVAAGTAAVVVMVLAAALSMTPGVAVEDGYHAWCVSLVAGTAALLAGLAARGRRATYLLVVPSLVYLVVVLVPG